MNPYFQAFFVLVAAILTPHLIRYLQVRTEAERYWLAVLTRRERQEAERQEKGFE